MQPMPYDPTTPHGRDPMTGQPRQPMPYTPDPEAPYGRDPLSGQPLSDKQKLAAGLLQIFLGQWGVGRFYLGDSKQALIHLGLWFGSFFLILCGIAFIPLTILGFLVFLGNLGWALFAGIMILTDKVPDMQGRKLR